MLENNYLYEFLYQSLVTQIECGCLLAGQKLPSQASMCRQYNVGITTVRKVTQMLADAGYIRSVSGQPAEVIYRGNTVSYTAALLRRRGGIEDAYHGLNLLLPVLYGEGAKLLKHKDIMYLKAITAEISENMTQSELYMQSSEFFSALLRPFHNLLMQDLQVDSENYFRVPHIGLPDLRTLPLLTPDSVKSWLGKACIMIEEGSFSLFSQATAQMYNSYCENVCRFLDALNSSVPVESIGNNFSWFSSKGRTELYLHLTMSLLRRISTGEFADQKYLPSIPALMEQYGVMKNTACRAVSMLETAGIARTIDKKGTIILPNQNMAEKKKINPKDRIIQNKLILCLDALQMMALTVRESARLLFPYIDISAIPAMRRKLEGAGSLHLNSIAVQSVMDLLIHASPYHSVKNIYQQLYELMIWGYYLRFLEDVHYTDSSVIENNINCLLSSAEQGDCPVFCDTAEAIFKEIYRQVHFNLEKLHYSSLPVQISI